MDILHLFILIICLEIQSISTQCNGCNNDANFAYCSNLGLTEVPTCLPNTTTWLYLRENNLTLLMAESFVPYPELLFLDLTSSQIEILAPDTFIYVPKIFALYLSYNKLLTFSGDLLSYLPSLAIVELYNCQLVELPANAFANNPQLIRVTLSRNNLTSLPDSAFASLTNLIELYLEDNTITEIQDLLFTNNKELQIINLSNNELVSLNEWTFEPLSKLSSLDLFGNNIQQIQHISTFYFSENLFFLTLHDNNMVTLDPAVFVSLNNMYISLDGNPWLCDCITNELIQSFQSQNITLLKDPECLSPPDLEGNLWSNLGQLSCS